MLSLNDPAAPSPVRSSTRLTMITRGTDSDFDVHPASQLESLLPSGRRSLKERLLTSTTFYCLSIMLDLMRREKTVLVTLSSSLGFLKQKDLLSQSLIGLRLSGVPLKQLHLYSLIVNRSSAIMPPTSNSSSLPNNLNPILKSSYTILPSEMKLQKAKTISSPTLSISPIYMQQLSLLMESSMEAPGSRPKRKWNKVEEAMEAVEAMPGRVEAKATRPAIISMVSPGVSTKESCFFKHICKKCRKRGHARPQCPQNWRVSVWDEATISPPQRLGSQLQVFMYNCWLDRDGSTPTPTPAWRRSFMSPNSSSWIPVESSGMFE